MTVTLASCRPLRFVCLYKATTCDELTFAVRNEFMDFLLAVCKIHERVQVQ